MTRTGSGHAAWRLIVDDTPLSGAWNMALDRAMQLAHAAGDSLPTLRLYGWARPTLSLGRFQDVGKIPLDVCRDSGVDVVRRFTGGRGVLHDREVTYSIVAGVVDGVPRGTAASYRMLCGALVAAYDWLGVEARLTSGSKGLRRSSACYLNTTNADLTLNARKLSGSAQAWHEETVLQHGSLVISRDVELESRVMALGVEEGRALASDTATIAEALTDTPSPESIRTALIEGVTRSLGASLESGTYSSGEIHRAERLLEKTFIQGDPRPGPAPAGASG